MNLDRYRLDRAFHNQRRQAEIIEESSMPARQSDLFQYKAVRGKRLAMMHVCDAGDCETAHRVQFECKRCGHRSEWVTGLTVSVAKRGRPCPMCNVPHDGTPDDPAKAPF